MAAGAFCKNHEDRTATLTCERCGDFLCDDCVKTVAKRQVCKDCTLVSGVNFLEEYKQKVWGKRDGYVWFFGGLGTLTAAINLVGALVAIGVAVMGGATGANGLILGSMLLLGFNAVTLGLNICYLLLMRWARAALFIGPIFGALLLLYTLSNGDAPPETYSIVFLASLVPLLIVTSAFFSARNKLAFKIEIPEAKLQKLYQTYVDNRIARYALFFGILGLIFPPLFLIALPMGIIGLQRVDPEAWPPVGGKTNAIVAVVVSTLGIVGAGVLFVLFAL